MTDTNNILDVWNKRGNVFIQHIDGNTLNNKVDNLKWVNVKDAMDNFDEWITDWGKGLNRRQKRIVNLPSWRAGLIFTKK
jgi:hypothetical protein